MTEATSPSAENVFIRRMRMGRLRQVLIAVVSLTAAVFGVINLSPAMVGAFAYYTIATLLVISALLALRQSYGVLRPIETMLKRMQDIVTHVEDENNYNFEHLYNDANDEFACLAAGMDELVERLVEKTRTANERYLRYVAVIQNTPFTFFTVSPSGKVFNIIKDHFNLVPLLKLKEGETPDEKTWGLENLSAYQQSIRKAFRGQEIRWFDMQFAKTADQPEHNLRATVARLNDMSALVVMGDMPAIDRLVENMSPRPTQASRSWKHAALKRLAASVAHDGRNVFAALGNLVSLNKLSTDPNVREQTTAAEDAIRRGMNLMTELMQYAGETKYQLTCMPARDALTKLYDNPTLHAIIPENITLISDISKEPMPDIDIDTNQAWKISFNLAKNAVEAIGPAPGRIWMAAKPFTMTEAMAAGFRSMSHVTTGPGVLTTFSDDGPGIDPEFLDRLFDPYYSSKGEGRGLGLSTVLSIVEAHNGAIRVLSRPGMGTTFEIFHPSSRHAQKELDIIREVAPNGEILLIDDDPAILHTTSLVLRALKVAAHPAATADDARRTLRILRDRIRAVIVDAHLPQSQKLMRRIREDYPMIRIILSSGTPENALRNMFDPDLYDRFLSKPYTVVDLSAALA